MKVADPDPDEALLIPVDKRRFEVMFRNETESEVTIMVVPKDPPVKEDDPKC